MLFVSYSHHDEVWLERFTTFFQPLSRYTMMHGDFTNLSERKLMECLNRLGYDIEIKVRPAAEPIGHLTLATV